MTMKRPCAEGRKRAGWSGRRPIWSVPEDPHQVGASKGLWIPTAVRMTVGVMTMTMPCAEGAKDLLRPKYLYASVLGKVNPQHRSPGEREHEKTLLALQSTIRAELTGDCSSECGD